MDFSLSEEQTAIQELARQILSDRVTDEGLREFERGDDDFDHKLWAQLAESGLLGIALDEGSGGMGLGVLELALLLEEQGRTLAPVPLVPALALAALPIAAYGTEAQRQALLPGLASGEHWLTAGFHELGADLEAPKTRARRQGDGWALDGVKIAVPVAAGARRAVISASTDEGPALFLVDPDGAGVTLDRQRATNHSRQDRMTLEGAPAELLGDVAKGAEALAFALDRGRIALSAVMLGTAAEALRRTADYVSNRKQFGKPIGTFQGVALRSADGYIDIECMRSTLWQALWKLDAGREATAEVAVAKWWACRGGQRVVHSAQHLHGGIGADVDYPIHRFFLWAKQLEIDLGAGSQQLVALGRLIAEGKAAA